MSGHTWELQHRDQDGAWLPDPHIRGIAFPGTCDIDPTDLAQRNLERNAPAEPGHRIVVSTRADRPEVVAIATTPGTDTPKGA